jgi:hypothetical protein
VLGAVSKSRFLATLGMTGLWKLKKGRDGCAPTFFASMLFFGWGGSRRWGGGWSGIVEVDFGDFAARGGGLEVGVVAFIAGPGGEEAVGELADVGVIGLDGVVVVFAGDGDAIFGAGEFVLQAEEILVGLELGIVFDDGEEAADGAVELAVGGDFVGGGLRVEQSGASFRDFAVDGFFVGGEAFDGGDEIGDQVGAALELDVNLGPVGFDLLVERDHLIFAADVHAAEDGGDDDEDDDDCDCGFHCCAMPPG